MRISGKIPLKEVPLLHKRGIVLPGVNSKLCPRFEKETKPSKEEEDGRILLVLPLGHRIPLFPATRARLLSQAR